MRNGKKSRMSPRSEQEHHLRLLLSHLESADQHNGYWEDWQIARLDGGANNQLFRATRPPDDFVIKFTIRDDCNRAEREFEALSALEQAGLRIAPIPVLLDNPRYRQPVVVQTWIEGEGITHPPATDEEWQELLQHYLATHTVTPDSGSEKLPKAFSASTVAEGRALVSQQLARIPREAQPASLQDLIQRFGHTEIPEWEKAPVALCRIDPNLSNFIRRVDGLASVDWEYSGWGDPAYDMADLMAHPTYMAVPSSRWAWLIRTYGDLAGDPTAAIRIGAYYKILLVWWVARTARFLYETPRGLDNRLASLPADWQADVRMKYDHYLNLAESLT